MWQAFVYSRAAITIRHWFEIGLDDGVMEHGSRVELRLLAPQHHRGSESAAQLCVLDQPIWRADLFDRIGARPGTFLAAHFHSSFDGVEPGARQWSLELTRDPWGWLAGQLARVEKLLPLRDTAEDMLRADAEDVRRQVDHIVAAAREHSPAACASVASCYASTRDVAETVRLMVTNMDDVGLLDTAYVAPWLSIDPPTEA